MSYVNRVSQKMVYIHQVATTCSKEVPRRVSEKIWLILPEIQIFKDMRVYSHDKTKRDIFGIECEIYANFRTSERSQNISHFTVTTTLL